MTTSGDMQWVGRTEQPMSDEDAIKATQDGWTFVFQQGAMLAMMPIEDWLDAFDKADAVAPITDPTLYRDYLYSGRSLWENLGPCSKSL